MLGRVNWSVVTVKTQLIAHDKEVYDIATARRGGGRGHVAKLGADGSVRNVRFRTPGSTAPYTYEDPHHTPLLRLAWNKQDKHLATVGHGTSCEVIILDIQCRTPLAS